MSKHLTLWWPQHWLYLLGQPYQAKENSMFKSEDFQISMEKELRLRMVNDEINHCDNVEELRKQLINVTRLFTQYQHLLEIAVKQLIVQDGYALITSDRIETPQE